MRYVIKREDRPGLMLRGLGIGCNNNYYTNQTEWTRSVSTAIQFNEEEAQATIEFITNVIDWELGKQLIYEPVEDKYQQ